MPVYSLSGPPLARRSVRPTATCCNALGWAGRPCQLTCPTRKASVLGVLVGVSVTDTPTDTPTNTPSTDAFLVGHVSWQGRPAQPNALQQVAVGLTLRLASGGPDNEYTGMTTDPSGFFTATVTGLPSGTYNWRVKDPKYLANGGTVILPGAGTSGAEMGLMLAGDCNDDNVINATDFAILKST